MSVGDFFKGMGNDPLGTMGNIPLGTGALGAASLINMIGSYQSRKKQKQQQADAIAAQQARQHQINVNPNTGGANPIPNSRTQYLGTPNFNPFISQGPQDRLAFGPSPWQLGAPGQPPGGQPPGGQARGGLAGMNMRDPAQGALSLARGPGGGQDDKIPALLSDGEYVMDAGAVADLGDGSTKEGARRLDKLRQNLRMHKRAAPAASIPPKAKSPASYLRGKA
jgi:type II secretory pathway pseudopilin PulG